MGICEDISYTLPQSQERTNSKITNAGLHALKFEVLHILRGRYTDKSNYKSRVLQYGKLEMEIQK